LSLVYLYLCTKSCSTNGQLSKSGEISVLGTLTKQPSEYYKIPTQQATVITYRSICPTRL